MNGPGIFKCLHLPVDVATWRAYVLRKYCWPSKWPFFARVILLVRIRENDFQNSLVFSFFIAPYQPQPYPQGVIINIELETVYL